MDKAPCREHLSKLLQDEVQILARLETLLTDEHAVLASNDIEALEQTGSVRQGCMGELVKIEDERRSLCRMMGHSADLAGLESLLRWCDPGAALQLRWAECAARAKRCRELNDRNGMLVAGRLQRVQGLLNILTGQPKQAATYGRTGTYTSQVSGRVVQTEA